MNDRFDIWVKILSHNLQIPLRDTDGLGVTVTYGEPSMAIGSTLLIVFFTVGVIPYVVIGALLRHRQGERGMALLPHREFWAEIPGLARDGISYTWNTIRHGRGYTRL